MKVKEHIVSDRRPIVELGLQENVWIVPEHCDEIIPYNENGEMASVHWFAIFKGGEIIERVNGKFVISISYEPGSKPRPEPKVELPELPF